MRVEFVEWPGGLLPDSAEWRRVVSEIAVWMLTLSLTGAPVALVKILSVLAGSLLGDLAQSIGRGGTTASSLERVMEGAAARVTPR
jgi:hypothetical protein